jgi:hypothetical protein
MAFSKPRDFFKTGIYQLSRIERHILLIVIPYLLLAWFSVDDYEEMSAKLNEIGLIKDQTRLELLGLFVGISTIASYLSWYLFGFWYRIRLRFCNINNPDRILYRTAALFTELVYHIPYTLLLFLLGISDISEDNIIFQLVVSGIIMIWSNYFSYLGSIECFKVEKIKGIVWFLIVPISIWSIFSTFTYLFANYN